MNWVVMSFNQYGWKSYVEITDMLEIAFWALVNTRNLPAKRFQWGSDVDKIELLLDGAEVVGYVQKEIKL
jgi:hypothetical protein